MALIPPWIGRVGFLVAGLVSVFVVRWLDGSRDWGQVRRNRLILGVPWGTLVVIAGVLSVYLFVQAGLEHWNRPTVLPFQSWSYFYPFGVVVSGFAHQGAGHLIGNLIGTLVFGTLAEYAWGHFPESRGATAGSSLRTNPLARAFLLFPFAAFVVGLLTGVFGLGPTIGFSGVVFAFAGFALTRYPIATAVGILVLDVANLVYRAIQHPVVTAEAGPRFGGPWWAGISIQGHLLGLLIGVAAGILVFRHRSARPEPLRLWGGAFLFVVAENLWALWWFRGNNSFVLYRALGLWFVLTLALLIVLPFAASDRRFPQWVTLRRSAGTTLGFVGVGGAWWWTVGAPGAGVQVGTPIGDLPVVPGVLTVLGVVLIAVAALGGDDPLIEDLSRSDVASLAIALALVFSAVVAVPTNLATVGDAESPGDVSVEVRDYTVTYAENVTNGMVSVVDVSFLGETTDVRTSGVIVISESRHIWTTAISTSRLKFAGENRARIGGIGWRAHVTAIRRGWSAAGGPATYKVFIRGPDSGWKLAHIAPPAVASPKLSGNRVAISPTRRGFNLTLLRNDSSIQSVGVPTPGNATELSGITFVREGKRIYAEFDGTRIKVATRETYN